MTDIQHVLPEEIEKTSFQIIERELGERGRSLPEEHRHILLRVIHTTADFDYIDTMTFSEGAAEKAADAIRRGAHIVTDTTMAMAGINKRKLAQYGGEVHCYIAVFAVGNAPTALLALEEKIRQGYRPELVIAVPVGFVNVVQAKERIMATGVPYICNRGRKGGSNVAAAICNAILYHLESVN